MHGNTWLLVEKSKVKNFWFKTTFWLGNATMCFMGIVVCMPHVSILLHDLRSLNKLHLLGSTTLSPTVKLVEWILGVPGHTYTERYRLGEESVPEENGDKRLCDSISKSKCCWVVWSSNRVKNFCGRLTHFMKVSLIKTLDFDWKNSFHRIFDQP